MMGYTPPSARIYKHFCPKPSQVTYAQNSTESREEERLNILEQAKKAYNKNLYIENFIFILVHVKFHSLKVIKF